MRIPVFVSSPTQLSPEQESSRRVVMSFLDQLQMEPRALGRSDYPKDCPLKEVLIIAKHCAGGVILGFEQFYSESGTWKRGTKEKKAASKKVPAVYPSAWNNLEAGILFGLRLPLLIFREEHVSGGVFDVGTTEVFVHKMPPGRMSASKREQLMSVFLNWQGEVNRRYRDA
jgi:hypothetical protein